MGNQYNTNTNHDVLTEKFCNDEILQVAKLLLGRPDQTEEEFLGAQGVLLINGLL